MHESSERRPGSGDALTDGVPPALALVSVSAALAGAVAWACDLPAVAVWGVAAAFGAFQVVVYTWWRSVLHRSLEAPARSVMRAMERLRSDPEATRRACLPLGGGPLARSLTRHWNEVAARAAEVERDAAAKIMAVEMSRDRLRAVLDTITEGVLVIDSAGELVLANPAARSMLGCGERLLTGRRLEEITAGDLRQRLRDALDSLRDADGGRQDVQGIIHRGKVLDATALRVQSRDLIDVNGVVVVLADVTRHGEIRRVKDKFLSSMSHELRTPLTSICSYAEILQGMVPGQDAEWPEFLKIIHGEGLRLAALVDAVLDYVRMEAGEVLWQRKSVDLAEVASAVYGELSPQAEVAKVRLELDRDPRPCPVVGDRAGLARAVRLLVDNGLKFVPPGGRVVITVGREGNRVRLRVEDDGVGIPAHLREDAFERFHQPRDHLTEKPDGLGLGLPTCRLIVAQHGGAIWCDDSPLGGARLQFVIPLAGPATDADRPALEPANSGGTGLADPNRHG